MYNVWFISDTHFGHANIIKYCNRPFDTVEQMDQVLIANWNSLIRPKDLVYHLGDVGFGNLESILNELHGRKILILGNHDATALKVAAAFKEITPLKTISINKQRIILCHYCMRVWEKSHHNSWHLYGHSHGTLEPIGKSWDVGVDNNNFSPLNLDSIIEIMAQRPDNEILRAPRYGINNFLTNDLELRL